MDGPLFGHGHFNCILLRADFAYPVQAFQRMRTFYAINDLGPDTVEYRAFGQVGVFNAVATVFFPVAETAGLHRTPVFYVAGHTAIAGAFQVFFAGSAI